MLTFPEQLRDQRQRQRMVQLNWLSLVVVDSVVKVAGERCRPALTRFLVERRQPMLDQLLLQVPSGAGGLGNIRAETDAEPLADAGALQGLSVASQVSLAIVVSLPALIGSLRFSHVKQQRLFQIDRAIQHQVDRSPLVRTVGPTPEAQGKGRQGQGLNGRDWIRADIPEQ